MPLQDLDRSVRLVEYQIFPDPVKVSRAMEAEYQVCCRSNRCEAVSAGQAVAV